MTSQCSWNRGQDTQNGPQALCVCPCFFSIVIISHSSSQFLHSNYPDFFHFLKSIMLPSIIGFVCADRSACWRCTFGCTLLYVTTTPIKIRNIFIIQKVPQIVLTFKQIIQINYLVHLFLLRLLNCP